MYVYAHQESLSLSLKKNASALLLLVLLLLLQEARLSSGTDCTRTSGWSLHHNWDFGILASVGGLTTDATIKNSTVADTKHGGILILRKGSGTVEASSSIENVTVIGYTSETECVRCIQGSDSGCHSNLSPRSYRYAQRTKVSSISSRGYFNTYICCTNFLPRSCPFRDPTQDTVGIISAAFARSFSPGPDKKPWDSVMGYPIVHGYLNISKTHAFNFAGSSGDFCGIKSYAMSNNIKAPDANHPVYISEFSSHNVSSDGVVKLYDSPVCWW